MAENDEEERVLQTLRRNESTQKKATIRLSNTNAPLFGEALRRNTHVTKLKVVILDELTDIGACEALLQSIRQSQTIRKFSFESFTTLQLVNSRITGPFLEAVSVSTSIRRFILNRCQLPCALFCTFIRQTRTVTDLKLVGCTFLAVNQAEMQDLEAAVGESVMIKTWDLSFLNGTTVLQIFTWPEKSSSCQKTHTRQIRCIRMCGPGEADP
jgi:hypothetical protein